MSGIKVPTPEQLGAKASFVSLTWSTTSSPTSGRSLSRTCGPATSGTWSPSSG